jgi:hypothetical protein
VSFVEKQNLSSGPLRKPAVGSSATFSHRSAALPAGYSVRGLGGDALYLGPVSDFAVARIAGDHAVFVQQVQVPNLALRLHWCDPIALSRFKRPGALALSIRSWKSRMSL